MRIDESRKGRTEQKPMEDEENDFWSEDEDDLEDHPREGRHDSVIESHDRKIGAQLPSIDKEYRKTYDEVFNDSTLKTIYRLFQRKVLDSLEYPISTGKEANVFLGMEKVEGEDRKPVAVKIFRESTTTFRKVLPYIEGDPRFKHIVRGRRGLVSIWAKKEYKNLKRMENAGVRVPCPSAQEKNILIMEYIGIKNRPSPTLRQWYIENKDRDDIDKRMKRIYKQIARAMKRTHREAGLVHSDLSEFNILIFRGNPVIIDMGQAVVHAHPMSGEFLRRDIRNIAAYFRRRGVDSSEEDLMSFIIPSSERDTANR